MSTPSNAAAPAPPLANTGPVNQPATRARPFAAPVPAVTAQPTPAPSRMTLASVRSSRRVKARRTLLYATDGVGKSTFGSEAPSPIFLAAEKGLEHLNVPVFPEPQTFDDILAAIDELTTGTHTYRTLVLDTIDWVEPLIWAKVCRANAWRSIDEPGTYGKGYVFAAEEWRLLLGRLERLWEKKDMEILLLAHARVLNFKNPSGSDYGRFVACIHERGYDPIKQWVDCVLFGAYEETTTDPKKGRVKGVFTGRRVIYTYRTAAWDGKNRLGLPPTLPLEYAEYARAAEAGLQADPAAVLAECRELQQKLGLLDDGKVNGFLEKYAGDAPALLQGLNRLRVQAAEAGLE